MASRAITAIPGEEWGKLFTGFTASAFRLETVQHSRPLMRRRP